mmetsp:Transcript_4144/g.6024  ORF Transcript_4144/g.6024 Transcript_4144/m.6024 type:complete len:83 (-) Transcript_4144:1098-1346(-)
MRRKNISSSVCPQVSNHGFNRTPTIVQNSHQSLTKKNLTAVLCIFNTCLQGKRKNVSTTFTVKRCNMVLTDDHHFKLSPRRL